MKAQHYDHPIRVVSLANLQAMCSRVSGTCHRYVIDGMTAHRVRVSYSNPDEYGNPCPVIAHLPTYPGSPDLPFVVLDPVRWTGGRKDDDEAWQAFDVLWECPTLYPSIETGEWQTELEILQKQFPGQEISSKWLDGGSRQIFLYQGQEYTQRSKAEEAALNTLRTLKTTSHANS